MLFWMWGEIFEGFLRERSVVGAKEEEEGKVSVRSRFAGDEGQCGLEEFIEQIKEEVAAKKLRETVQDK